MFLIKFWLYLLFFVCLYTFIDTTQQVPRDFGAINKTQKLPQFAHLISDPNFSDFQSDSNLGCSGHVCRNNGTCVESIDGSVSCRCTPQFTGENCSEDVDECVHQRSNPCKNGATCVNNYAGFSCICVNGWTGPDCSENIDDCESAQCKNGATCHDRVGAYVCECPPGKTGLLCQLDDQCINNPCEFGAQCYTSPVDGTYSCSCKEGFSGYNCTDIDECESGSPCEHGGSCVNTPGSFRCECPVGFKGSRCEININECQLYNPCRNEATCLDEKGRYRCICKDGFTGEHCQIKTNTTQAKPRPWKKFCSPSSCLHGKCIEKFNNFSCLCDPGFTGSRCQMNINECSNRPCLNGGTCIDKEDGFICKCLNGTSGQRCEIDFDNCYGNPCYNGGTCIDGINSFTCTCPNDYDGPLCENHLQDCAKYPCINGRCIERQKGSKRDLKCICDAGFTGPSCERDIDECLAAFNPCRNNATCENIPGSFRCHCLPGFEGENCLTDIDECKPKPCHHGGICMDDIADYQCVCPHNYVGRNCEIDVREINHRPDPWIACPMAKHCAASFRDDLCNPECNNRGCLFDGFDCDDRPSQLQRCEEKHYCLRNYGNGFCDRGCDNEQCGWDGGDCEERSTEYWSQRGTVELFVDMPAVKNYSKIAELIQTISRLTNLVVRLRFNDQNEPEITHIAGTNLTKLPLVLDTSKCKANCLEDSSAMAQFLTATIDSARNREPLLGPVRGIHSTYRVEESNLPTNPLTKVILCFIFGCVMVVALVKVVVFKAIKKRKKVRAPVWKPEGFTAPIRSDSTTPLSPTYDLTTEIPTRLNDRQSKSKSNRKLFYRKRGLDERELRNLMNSNNSSSSVSSNETKVTEIYREPPDPRSWSVQHYEAYTANESGFHDLGDVDIVGPAGLTPLMIASAYHGPIPYCGAGADEVQGGSPASLSNDNTNLIQDLLLQGADVKRFTETTGETALHLAARHSRSDNAKRLIESGADCNAQDLTGRTPLHAAVANDARGVLEHLIQHRSTDLNSRANDGTTPLILAARMACEQIFSELIKAGADVNSADDNGKTALHWAAAVNNVEAIRLLLQNGANKDAQDNEEATPLLLAAREGSLQAAEILLEHYANKDLTDHMDRRARDIASERFHQDIVELLDSFSSFNEAMDQGGPSSSNNPEPSSSHRQASQQLPADSSTHNAASGKRQPPTCGPTSASKSSRISKPRKSHSKPTSHDHRQLQHVLRTHKRSIYDQLGTNISSNHSHSAQSANTHNEASEYHLMESHHEMHQIQPANEILHYEGLYHQPHQVIYSNPLHYQTSDPPELPPRTNTQCIQNYEHISSNPSPSEFPSAQQAVMLSPTLSYTTIQSPMSEMISPQQQQCQPTSTTDPISDQFNQVKSPPHPQTLSARGRQFAYRDSNCYKQSRNMDYPKGNRNYHLCQTSNIDAVNNSSSSSDACYLTPSPHSPETWSMAASSPLSASEWSECQSNYSSFYSQVQPPNPQHHSLYL
ncbi:uncharacterized protein LOC141854320 isoform X2 [Brevipalpus obovatus]|uniref:uncharacterized protein LOC141854320 isoform X2 n=1 Tax=Brevipalpus obovatus TaxID=246614 RepID=UPI003D9DE7E6